MATVLLLCVYVKLQGSCDRCCRCALPRSRWFVGTFLLLSGSEAPVVKSSSARESNVAVSCACAPYSFVDLRCDGDKATYRRTSGILIHDLVLFVVPFPLNSRHPLRAYRSRCEPKLEPHTTSQSHKDKKCLCHLRVCCRFVPADVELFYLVTTMLAVTLER